MGISERKEREKEEIKKSILEAAKELFIKRGFEETSIRNIADKIEYSPTTIYLYFKDKNAIFHALHEEGFRNFRHNFQSLGFVADPFERLKAMGKVYIAFGLENPEFYNLMFILDSPMAHMESCELEWYEGQQSFNMLTATVGECVKFGYFRKDLDVQIASFLIWSALHGMLSLFIKERCVKVVEGPKDEAMVHKGLDTFILFLEQMKEMNSKH